MTSLERLGYCHSVPLGQQDLLILLGALRHQLPSYLSGWNMKILILTTEPLPFPGLVTTGAGLRAWGLARGLESAGLSVEVAMPDEHLEGLDPQRRAAVEPHCFSRAHLGEFVRRRSPDAIVMQHWGLMRELGHVDCPLAIDLAGPHLLERRFWGSRSPENDRAEKIEALQRADFVTCSGRSQRFYFLAFLDLAGFDVTDPDLCPVIPFSADPNLPPEGERDLACFIYGGMFLPWQDPTRALMTVLDAFGAAGRGRLRFFGGAHPSVDVSRGRFDHLVERLNSYSQAGSPRHPTVEMCGLRPFDQLVAEYCRAGVALDLMERNAERELAFPTRTVIYLWCGLPVIHPNYTDLVPLIERYNAGWVLDPGDMAGLREIIKTILGEPDVVLKKGQDARRLVADQLTWDKTIAPLAAWCHEPKVREDKQLVAMREVAREHRLADLESELAATRSELDRLRGKWIFRLAQKRRVWGPLLAPFAFLASVLAAIFLFFALWITRRSIPKNTSGDGGTSAAAQR